MSTEKKLSKEYDKIFTCYHEAGHVIYALLSFIKVESVFTYYIDNYSRIIGETEFCTAWFLKEPIEADLLSKLLEAEIGFLYAGLASEKYHYHCVCGSEKFPMVLKTGSKEDRTRASKIIRDYNITYKGARRKYRDKIFLKVKNTLKDNWDAVVIIAHALYKNKKLTYQKIFELLSRRSVNSSFWKKRRKQMDRLYSTCDLTKIQHII